MPVRPSVGSAHNLAKLALILVCAAASLTVAACGDDEEAETLDSAADVSGDQGGTDSISGGISLDGAEKVYRFTALELSEPDVSLRIMLNAMINANINATPDDPLVVNVLLHLRNWDLTATPVGVDVGGGAGEADLSGAEPVYSFKSDAAPSYVAAQYRDAQGTWKIQNDQPMATLMFPVIVRDTTFMLPLRDIILDACYGGAKSCSGTDESKIYGTLAGGIIEAEADGIQVEIDETTVLPLGDVLRDAKGACASSADCSGTRVCGDTSRLCERAPDLTIDGQEAFGLAGRFVAELVPFPQ